MRELCQKVMDDAKKSARRAKVKDKDVVFALVVDYCQNMEMSFFGMDQPGKTCCHTTNAVNVLRIVDCDPEREVLHACAHSEEEGGQQW